MMRPLLTLLLAGCSVAGVEPGPASLELPSCGSITDHGAVANDGLDDSPAVQAAVDACAAAGGGTVSVPVGVYTLARHGGWAYFAVGLADGVELRGDSRAGSILRLAPGSASSVKLLQADGTTDAAVTNITLDGDKANQTVNEHRHGVVVQDSARFRVEQVTAQNFTGDGVYLYNGVTDATVRDVRATGNTRNGLTIAPSIPGVQVRGVSVSNSQFVANAAQQFDSEPGGEGRIEDVRISDCLFDAEGISTEYVLTISGTSTAFKGNGWHVVNSRINGPIVIVWFDDVTLTGNTIQNPTTKAAILVYRTASRVAITGNRIALTSTTVTSGRAVYVAATSSTSQPDDIVISSNIISAAFATNMGIDIGGAARATITGNTISGAGSVAWYPGIRVRGTVQSVKSVIVTGNNIRGFVKGFDVHDAQNVQTVVVTGNTFNDLPLVWP